MGEMPCLQFPVLPLLATIVDRRQTSSPQDRRAHSRGGCAPAILLLQTVVQVRLFAQECHSADRIYRRKPVSKWLIHLLLLYSITQSFPQARNHSNSSGGGKKGLLQIGDFLQGTEPYSLDYFQNSLHMLPTEVFLYHQSMSFIRTKPKKLKDLATLTLFEYSCKATILVKDHISILYELLVSPLHKLPYMTQWEQDLWPIRNYVSYMVAMPQTHEILGLNLHLGMHSNGC